MRFVLSVVIICCLVIVSTAAESEQEDWKNHKPDSGDKAFLFQMGTNLRVRSLSGVILGLKYHRSTTRALELRIGLNGRTFDDEVKYEEFDDSLEIRERTGDGYNWTIRFSGVYLMYLDRPSNLIPFWGIGPTFQYHYSYSEYSEYNGYASNSESKDIDVGLTGDIGFEWFILPKVSLVAKYRMKLLYSWDTDTHENWNDDKSNKRTSERKSIKFGYENTDLGIALYF